MTDFGTGTEGHEDCFSFSFDFGGGESFEGGEFDGFDAFDFSEDEESARYTKPKARRMKSSQVCYDNARKLASELTLNKGERSDCFVSGDFIFGDFIEAYLVHHKAKAVRMYVSTLSLSQENVDSLRNLMKCDYIGELHLFVSVYFFAHERRGLVPYIIEKLDAFDRVPFQLSVADIHTKTVHFETLGGRKIVIHGSANLRSSGNIEQFTIEENEDLYGFYCDVFSNLEDKYKIISTNGRSTLRGKEAWEAFTKRQEGKTWQAEAK